MGSGISLRRLSSRGIVLHRSTSSSRSNTPSNPPNHTLNQSRQLLSKEPSKLLPNEGIDEINSSDVADPMDQELERLKYYVSEAPTGKDVDIYKYYCPLCMNHFQKTLKSVCCGNYVCYGCSVQYLCTKKIEIDSARKLINSSRFSDVSCPNCSSMGLQLALVNDADPIRNYIDTDDLSVSPRNVSPVRIGDTFDNLKRKMVKYNSKQSQSAVSGGCHASSGCLPTMTETEPDQLPRRFSIDENDESDNLSEYNEMKIVDYNESFNHYSISNDTLAEDSTLSENLLSLSMESSSIVTGLSHSIVDTVMRDLLEERIVRL